MSPSNGFTSSLQISFGQRPKHYENMPMQYITFFHSCKNNNFQMKNCNVFCCCFFAQNIDFGYKYEPAQRGGSNEYPQSMFWSKIRKKYTPVNPILQYKSGVQGVARG